ncbi:MAG: ABC transporter ATP-binding protein [Acidimicrobiales bacterium]
MGPSDTLAPDRPGPPRTLGPTALAEAAIMADVAMGLALLGRFLPFGYVLLAASVVPFATLAYRYRLRSVAVSTCCAVMVGFLVGRQSLAIEMLGLGALGWAVGMPLRRGWGLASTILLAMGTTWAPTAMATDAFLGLFSGLRHLTLAQFSNGWRGTSHLLDKMSRFSWLHGLGLRTVARWGDHMVRWMVAHWWLVVPAGELVGVLGLALVSRALAHPVLGRLAKAIGPAPGLYWPEPELASPSTNATTAIGPVPLVLERVGYEFPGATVPALVDVDLTVVPGQLVAVVGENGSGKTTLARVLAGLAPTGGKVTRPGQAGLGRPGGTAVISQRPESQVLGARVMDDLAWGVPCEHDLDVAGLLAKVGLDGFEGRETATLSGGELQRLAIASALARRPSLLISDESTSMLDSAGRRSVIEVLASLAEDKVAVVHITHRHDEVSRAGAVIQMTGGRATVSTPDAWAGAEVVPATGAVEAPRSWAAPAGPSRACAAAADRDYSQRQFVPDDRRKDDPGESALLVLDGVGHVYSRGSPWAHRALDGVDLAIRPAEAVLVAGHNGSGKSTLAWVMAGLLAPSEGTVRLDGAPMADSRGRVGIAFQHARLQLLRPKVGSDVALGAGGDRQRADDALKSVGLEPEIMSPRYVDHLSGGEQRRVALAGILVRDPVVVVLDEPLAGLDRRARVELQGVLLRLRQDKGLAIVVVSHDLDEPEAMAERLVVIGRGRIQDDTAIVDGEHVRRLVASFGAQS